MDSPIKESGCEQVYFHDSLVETFISKFLVQTVVSTLSTRSTYFMDWYFVDGHKTSSVTP